MAWLQSSFTTHQLLVDSNSNKKGPKSSSVYKHSTDPDKSNTPLLDDTSQSPEKEVAPDPWPKSSRPSTEKKSNSSFNSSKSSFLSHSLFDKSSKAKSALNPNASAGKKPAENKGLLSEENHLKNALFNDDSDEADSDDEWCLPRMGQYQKVKSVAEY